VAGVINLTDTAATGTGITINGATSTAGGGAITLTENSGGNIAVSASLGSTASGAIAINAGSANVTFSTAQTFYANDPVTVTAGDPEFLAGSALNLSSGSLTDSNGTWIDQGSSLAWDATGASTVVGPLTVAGTIAPTGSTTGALTETGNLTLNSTAIRERQLRSRGGLQRHQRERHGDAGSEHNATSHGDWDQPQCRQPAHDPHREQRVLVGRPNVGDRCQQRELHLFGHGQFRQYHSHGHERACRHQL
jgi:hypothetical protein